jgi:BirA family biotin operon repressor/biotin-[acetyl-CoA-carboxylase] ligase
MSLREGNPGTGRYNGGMECMPLSADLIGAACRGPAINIEVVAETGSTNSDLLARLPGLRAPVLRVAESQTAGRGRAGREWHSVPGGALTFSLAWKFTRPLARLAGLPLAVGVVLAEVLDAFGVEARLKWPNDVLQDGAKLSGILIETAAAANDETWAVIGVGLNIAQPEAPGVGRVAALPGLRKDRNRLMGGLLEGLLRALPQFDDWGFEVFQARWNSLHAYADQPVAILDRGAVLHEGRARGVDEQGRLLLDTAAGQVAVVAGDVSLRTRG